MDKTSKKILKYLRQNPDKILWYSKDPWNLFDVSNKEFFRCVEYLSSIGQIKYATNQFGQHLGVSPTHQAIHDKAIKWDSFKHWLLSTFVGGVITGICSTLAVETILYLCAKLAGLL